MGWAEVPLMVSSHAQSQDVVGFEWIGWGGWLTAEVAHGIGGEDALAFLPIATGVGVGSFSVGVAPVLATAGAVGYGWGVTE